MPPKGEFEVEYFGGPNNPAPCGGVNFSSPYTSIPPNDLAPGSVNTQNINGFLSSSPWVAHSPFDDSFFAANEFVIGTFNMSELQSSSGINNINSAPSSLIVTNIAVYFGPFGSGFVASQVPLENTDTVYTFSPGELNANFLIPGYSASFIQVNGNVFIAGLMFKGVYVYGASNSSQGTVGPFQKATGYVSGRWIAELAGRLVLGECYFPTGGGTGAGLLPTIAWSGVGVFGQAWDGNPAHDVWDPLNLNFFNGNIGGFNLLGDVPDQITGLATAGQSIIVVRNSGITQQDPNSTFSTSGIQPFNWYHMWASSQGVGGDVNTVAQYGQTVVFRSSDNVYSLSMSSGLSALAPKMIPKMVADQRMLDNRPGFLVDDTAAPPTGFENPSWNFSSIYEIDGQLHYLITLSAYLTNPSFTEQDYICYGYDLNMSDGSWHFWDFGQYFQVSSPGSGFLGFSCPLVQQQNRYLAITVAPPIRGITSIFSFLLFGAYMSYGTLSQDPSHISGRILQLVPYNYDFTSDWVTNYIVLLYLPLSLPSTTIVFRGETLSLGHKISTRRLRIQANNAPVPTVGTNYQQQAQVTFTGAGQNSVKQSPVINMQGNLDPTGLAIQTYYGDAVLSDEMVQPSLTSVFSSTTPWQTLCAFRIASASLIGIDATGTTQ